MMLTRVLLCLEKQPWVGRLLTCPRTGETNRLVVGDLPALRERILLDHPVDSRILQADDTTDDCGGGQYVMVSRRFYFRTLASHADLSESRF